MVCGPVRTVIACGLVGVVPAAGWARSWCVVACAGVTSGRVGSVTVCGPVRTVIMCGLGGAVPAAGWAQSWCVVAYAVSE
jgi:hypothetical protein